MGSGPHRVSSGRELSRILVQLTVQASGPIYVF